MFDTRARPRRDAASDAGRTSGGFTGTSIEVCYGSGQIRDVCRLGGGSPVEISDADQLQELNEQINNASKELKLAFEVGFLGWQFRSIRRKLKAAVDFNNRIFSTHLHKELYIADVIAIFLAVQFSNVKTMLDANDADHTAGLAILKAMGMIVAASVVPVTIPAALYSILSAAKTSNDSGISKSKILSDMSDILQYYRLSVIDDKFVLIRGSWGLDTRINNRGSYAPPLTQYSVRTCDVGVDPKIANAAIFRGFPPGSKINFGLDGAVREGFARSSWYS